MLKPIDGIQNELARFFEVKITRIQTLGIEFLRAIIEGHTIIVLVPRGENPTMEIVVADHTGETFNCTFTNTEVPAVNNHRTTKATLTDYVPAILKVM